MKIKKISWLFPCLLLGFGSVANAMTVADFDYTGTRFEDGGPAGNGVTVTGFGATDSDLNPFTQKWTWVIDEGGPSFHNVIGNPLNLPTIVAPGAIGRVIDLVPGGATFDLPIDVGFLADLASKFPITTGPVTFPAGVVAPEIHLPNLAEPGVPVFTTSLTVDLGFLGFVDSDFQVIAFDFVGNVMEMDILEVMNTDGTIGFGEFLAGPSPDGVFNRSFEIKGTVETTVVPVPAAFWLFGSAIVGLFASKRKAKLGNA